jgi:probable HAF family extracellular repeat protein
MKAERSICVTAMVFLVTLAISFSLAAQANAQHKIRYIVKDLGTLGGSFAAAGGISNTGWIEGYSYLPGDNEIHEFLYHDGVMKDLGTLGGPDSFSEYRPNNFGNAGGQSETSVFDPNGEDFCEFGTGLICLPFFWHNHKMTPQPTLGGNNGAGYGVNDLGEMAGTAENKTMEPTCAVAGTGELLQYKPAIWKDGRIRELPSFRGDPVGVAYAINNHSQAVGQSGPCGVEVSLGLPSHAMLWQNNKAINLGSLGGTLNNLAQDINDKGQVVGLSDLRGDDTFHAFLWQQNKMTDLGALPGDIHSNGESINIEGEVVGRSANADFSSGSAFVWRNGVMTDLNTLIPANSPLYLMNATSNNDLGQIVGSALQISSGEVHVFLATPIDCESGEGAAILFAPETVQRPNIFLSEHIRKLLQQPRRHIRPH